MPLAQHWVPTCWTKFSETKQVPTKWKHESRNLVSKFRPFIYPVVLEKVYDEISYNGPIWIPRSFSWGSATSEPLGETSQMEANDAFGGADLGGTLRSMHGLVLIEALMQWHLGEWLGIPKSVGVYRFHIPASGVVFWYSQFISIWPSQMSWNGFTVWFLWDIYVVYLLVSNRWPGFSSQGDLSLLLCFDDEKVIFRRWEKSWHSKPHVDKMVIRRMDGLVEQVAVFRIWV